VSRTPPLGALGSYVGIFHGTSALPQRAKSVTHVSGMKCHPSLRKGTSGFQRFGLHDAGAVTRGGNDALLAYRERCRLAGED
jgi:hypothetical protein